MTSFRGKLVDFLVFWRNLLAIAMDLLRKLCEWDPKYCIQYTDRD